MFMSVRVGTNDIENSRAFYDATFTALGANASVTGKDAPVALYRLPGGLVFIVGPTLNREPATFANGGTFLLVAQDAAMVDAWHSAGLQQGGACEGPPGPRAQAGGRYGAYLRDPAGNKFGCYVGSLFA